MSLMIRCNVTGLTTYIFSEGEQYVGEWKNGKPNGQGTYTSLNGAQYVGEFKNGNYDGQGTYTFPDGEIQSGTWSDGKFIEEKVHSLCQQYGKNGKRTSWYENGQKSSEATYKEGKLISDKCWDEDGNETECTEPPN